MKAAPEIKPAEGQDAPAAAEPSAFSLRDAMRRGMEARPIRQVVLPQMPSARRTETLLIPRSPALPKVAALGNRRKFVIVQGPQNSGKTLDMRMHASEAKEGNRLDKVVYAAIDHGPRTLALFVAQVEQPDSASQEDCVRFIGDAHNFMATGGENRPGVFVMDCGGNNTSLPAAIEANPSFVAELEAAEVAVVLAYYFVPRTGDLSLLDQHKEIGLVSPNTALVMNMAKAGRGLESFETMRGQGIWQEALARGGVELVQPALSERWAQNVEDLALPFWAARDGVVPAGLDADPLPVAGRVAVAEWMDRWRQSRAPIASWLT
jgi:hypothetical protein